MAITTSNSCASNWHENAFTQTSFLPRGQYPLAGTRVQTSKHLLSVVADHHCISQTLRILKWCLPARSKKTTKRKLGKTWMILRRLSRLPRRWFSFQAAMSQLESDINFKNTVRVLTE